MKQETLIDIGQLSDAKRQLFERYMRGPGATAAQTSTIPRLPAGSPAPLSFGQEQIWLHSQFAPETPLYNEPVTIRRQGTLDRAILLECLQEIVRRHESLRTCFFVQNGKPVQQVQPFRPVGLEYHDLEILPFQDRLTEAYRLATLGFVMLSAALVFAVLFSARLFGKPFEFNHQTVFGVASWLLFAVLLLGRKVLGWRGRRALRWLFSGSALLLLSYVGSRFVLQVILHR